MTKDNHRQLREDMSDSDLPTSDSYDSNPLIDLRVVAGVIQHGNHILAAKRLAGGPSGLKWEFPGGKVEGNEDLAAALARELTEELGLNPEVGNFVTTVEHTYPDFSIKMHCFLVHLKSFEGELKEHINYAHVTLAEADDLDWIEADRKV